MQLTGLPNCCSTRVLGGFNKQTKASLEKLAATGIYEEKTPYGTSAIHLQAGTTYVFSDMPEAGSGVGILYEANGFNFLAPAIRRKAKDVLFQSELLNKRPDNKGIHVFLWTYNGPDAAALSKAA